MTWLALYVPHFPGPADATTCQRHQACFSNTFYCIYTECIIYPRIRCSDSRRFNSLRPVPDKLLGAHEQLSHPAPDKLSGWESCPQILCPKIYTSFLLSKICIINDAGETTNSLLPSAFHSPSTAENLCDLVDMFASICYITFKWFYSFVCCCLSLTMCWERMSASQIFILILSMQNSFLNRHAKFEVSKWSSFWIISV